MRGVYYAVGMTCAYGALGIAVVVSGARFGELNSNMYFNFVIAVIFFALSLAMAGVWNLDFFDHWLSFNGFADFWREARPWQGTEFIFITEPQLWVNLNKIKGWENINLSVGTEVELSCNFVNKGFYVMPTVGAKWTF